MIGLAPTRKNKKKFKPFDFCWKKKIMTGESCALPDWHQNTKRKLCSNTKQILWQGELALPTKKKKIKEVWFLLEKKWELRKYYVHIVYELSYCISWNKVYILLNIHISILKSIKFVAATWFSKKKKKNSIKIHFLFHFKIVMLFNS